MCIIWLFMGFFQNAFKRMNRCPAEIATSIGIVLTCQMCSNLALDMRQHSINIASQQRQHNKYHKSIKRKTKMVNTASTYDDINVKLAPIYRSHWIETVWRQHSIKIVLEDTRSTPAPSHEPCSSAHPHPPPSPPPKHILGSRPRLQHEYS